MPNTTSAKKRMRQDGERRDRSRARRSVVKTHIRKFLEAIRANDAGTARSEFSTTTKLLDQSAAKGTYHKNTVARKKSRLAARLNAMSQAAA